MSDTLRHSWRRAHARAAAAIRAAVAARTISAADAADALARLKREQDWLAHVG